MKKKRNYKKIKIIVGVAAILIILLAITVQARGITFEQLTSYIESLTSDRKIQDVIEKIDNIGEVEYTQTCLSKIVIAENAYNDLTSEQKQKVTNYDKLVLARKTYEILAADNVDTTSLVKKDSGAVENVKWYVYENGLLEITGEGQIPDYSSSNLAPWHNYKDIITKVLVRSSVTKIGSFAFYGCNNVTEMTIPFIGQSRTATLEKSAFGYIFGYSTNRNATIPNSYIYDANGTKTTISSAEKDGFVNAYYDNSSSTSTAQGNAKKAWYSYKSGSTIYSYLYDTIPSKLKKVTITDASIIQDGAFNNCKNITEINVNEQITEIGKYAFQNNTSLKEFIIPENVTSIGEYGFYGCSSLLETKLPDNVETINRYTFAGCTNLKNVIISKSAATIDAYAFYRCSNITNIIIPNSVETIGNYAFTECTKLNNVEIGERLKTIGIYAFQKCTSLTNIIVPNNVQTIGYSTFNGCTELTEITLPFIGKSRTATLEKSAFGYIFGYSTNRNATIPNSYIYDANGTKITISSSEKDGFVNGYYDDSATTSTAQGNAKKSWYSYKSGSTIYSYLYDTIPTKLKKVTITDASIIPDGAFNNCKNITEININDQITEIGKCAFQNNTRLTGFVIPENVTSIGEYGFYGCSSLIEIKLPDNIEKINKYTFAECTNLNKAIISKFATIIDEFAFYNCSNITEITIPNKVITIGNYAFSKCANLINITIPNSVETIENYAFTECTKLNNVEIGEGLKTIGIYAFQKCTSLTNIIVPNNVQTIGYSTFNGCTSLTEITLPFIGKSRTATLEKSAFGYIFGYSTNRNATIPNSYIYNANGTKTTISSSEKDGFVNGYYDDSSTTSTAQGNAKKSWYSYKSGSTIYSYLYDTIPTKLKKVTITDASIIQDGAFNNCKNITEININDGVTSIGYSFQNVPWYTNLSDEFVIKGNNVLIKYNGGKSSVTIPENVICIAGVVFENNTNISEAILPNNLKEIGWHCFNGCTNLTSIIIPKSVTKIGSLAIPDTCKIKVYRPSAGYDYRETNREIINYSETIGNDTYYYNIEENGNAEIIGCDTTSTELTIPSKLGEYTIDKIGDYGIANCTTIKSVTIPSNIKNIGNYAFYKCTSLVNATIPPTVDGVGEYAFRDCTGLVNVTISEGVKLLGKGTFYNCTSLVEAVVPDTVEKLGEYAFYNCKAMAKATIGTTADAINKYTFYNCNKLETVVIGINVKYIDDYAFYNCALTRVTVPSTVTKIGEFAFEKCNALERATLRKNLLTIGKGAFKDCEKLATISIPTTVTEIGSSAFENCSSILAITIPEGLTNIDDRVFSNCSSLATVTINSKLTSIGTASFYNCAISEIALPDTLEIIKSLAFAKCKNLKQITIPSATLEIGDSAFLNCTSLEMVSMADTVKKIGKGTFFKNNDLTINVRYEKGILADNLFENQGMSHIVLDENITTIGNKTFAECYSLNDITYGEEKAEVGKYLFSKNMQTIGQEAFKDNGKLRNFVVPDTIKTIGQNAFYNNVKNKHNCKDITVTFYYVEGAIEENILKSQNVWNIILEDNIHSIGNSAFANCSALETISIPDTITSVGSGVFESSGEKLVATFRGVDGTIDDSIYKNKTKGINSIYIDENVKTIGEYAFAENDGIENVVVSNTEVIGKYAFAENDDIEQVAITKADTIDENAFENDVQIKTLTIDSAKNINNYAFHNCNSINKITIDKDLINIGDHAFDSCKHIPEVVLPDTVRKIGVAAFYDCNSMKSINIPNGIDKINNQTFFGCANLLKVALPNTVKSIGEEAYYGCVLINNLKVGNNLEEIKQKAFYNCNEVKELELPTTLKSIGDYAFRACKFEKISIPDSVETIGECVFYGCTELKEADFGNGITSIENSVFYGCVNLTKLILNGIVTSIHELAFYGAEDTEIYSHENDYVKNYCDEQGLVFYELIDEFTMSLKEPNKKEYIEFEELDLTGLELLISFSDGTTRTVTTGYNLSGYNSEKIGTQTITVEYKGKTETFDVTVVEKKVVSLNCKETNKITITTGEELDLSNVKIIATYNDGETKELKNGYSINNFDNKQIGIQNVTISYRGIDTNILVEVVDYIPGDINGDGIVSMKDVTRLNNYLNDDQTKVIKAALDVNGDGVVSIKDITRLVEYLSDNTVEIH